MRILMLGTTFPRHRGSSVGTFVFALARALAARNRVDVLTTHFPGGCKEELLDGVHVHRFAYFLPTRWQRLTYPGGLPDQLAVSWLARLQVPVFLLAYVVQCARRLRQAEVVICNWIYTATIAQMAMRLARVKRPCITVIRGSDMRWIEKGGIAGRLFVHTLRRADAVCVVARDFVPLLETYGITNVHFTPNGVAAEVFGMERSAARNALGLDATPIVLYVGSLIERKSVGTFVQAMEGLEAILTVIGEGPCRADLEALANRLGVEARFMGAVAPDRIPQWMAAATMVVLPSLYEGRPNVLIEAMAAGRACVATNIKGSRELIADGETGFLVPVQSPSAIRDRVQRLLQDDDLRTCFEAAARRRVREHIPSWEACAAAYLEIARTLTSGRDDE